MEGYLFKWTNFIKGWTIRYFLLTKHILYYMKEKGDTEKNAIHLKIAKVLPEKNKRSFVIDTGTNKIYLKANTEEERDIWISAITNEILILNQSHSQVSIKEDKQASLDDPFARISKLNAENEDKKKEEITRKSVKNQPIENDIAVDIRDLLPEDKKENIINFEKASWEKNDKMIISKIDDLTANIQNFQETYFKLSMGLENVNLSFMKNKSKEELKKQYLELVSIKQEFKGCIDQGYKNIITLKELVKHVLDLYKSDVRMSFSRSIYYITTARSILKEENDIFYSVKESPLLDVKKFLEEENQQIHTEEENKIIEEKNDLEMGQALKEDHLIDKEPNKITLSNSDVSDSDSSFSSCADKKNSEASLSKRAVIDEKTMKKINKNKAKFEQSLSKVCDDFCDNCYSSKREKLPCLIKVSNSMLSDMLKSITKDKIELPIHYNEPLSMLQKLCERFQYSYLLNQGASQHNKLLHLAFIAGFILGEVSLNINRILKPFNPILGETYEYYDNDMKFRYFSEQVSHHPPVSAYICESEDYVVFGDSRCKSKFKILKGAMELIFTNRTHIIFKTTNDHFSYSKPIMYLKGLVMGKPRYDFAEHTRIINHNTEDYLILEFFEEGKKNCPNGYVEGKICNKNNETKYYLRGSWMSALYVIELKNNDEKEIKSLDFGYLVKNAIKINNIFEGNETINNSNVIIYQIWSVHDDEFIKNINENDYKISKYAYNLNYIDDVISSKIPKTDSRFRPDQRALENQNLELADREKKRIEDKQRNRHKIFEENKIKYEPKYFNEVLDTVTNENVYLYKGDYWKDRNEGKFEDVYQIFFD